ncbi:MAG: hypothetical protein ACR2KM_06630 [Gemmatimonadaceae bacterium]
MALTPLERRAAFAHSVTMHETSKGDGALSIGYSWTHVDGVMEGTRPGSEEMKAAVAEYCGFSVEQFWGESRGASGAALQKAS